METLAGANKMSGSSADQRACTFDAERGISLHRTGVGQKNETPDGLRVSGQSQDPVARRFRGPAERTGNNGQLDLSDFLLTHNILAPGSAGTSPFVNHLGKIRLRDRQDFHAVSRDARQLYPLPDGDARTHIIIIIVLFRGFVRIFLSTHYLGTLYAPGQSQCAQSATTVLKTRRESITMDLSERLVSSYLGFGFASGAQPDCGDVPRGKERRMRLKACAGQRTTGTKGRFRSSPMDQGPNSVPVQSVRSSVCKTRLDGFAGGPPPHLLPPACGCFGCLLGASLKTTRTCDGPTLSRR